MTEEESNSVPKEEGEVKSSQELFVDVQAEELGTWELKGEARTLIKDTET